MVHVGKEVYPFFDPKSLLMRKRPGPVSVNPMRTTASVYAYSMPPF
jgi:hypothetical protein